MISISISDTASPAVRALPERVSPRQVAIAVGPATMNLITGNYRKQPVNKMGYPSTGFWADAIRATRLEIEPDGPLIITDKIGVRQRYWGGRIEACQGTSHATGAPTKYLTIAASPESYGKSASEIAGLKFVRFGRGQDAPAALVRVLGETAVNIEPKQKGKGFKPTSSQLGLVVLFWLKHFVDQKPNPAVLPSDDEFEAVIAEALKGLLP